MLPQLVLLHGTLNISVCSLLRRKGHREGWIETESWDLDMGTILTLAQRMSICHNQSWIHEVEPGALLQLKKEGPIGHGAFRRQRRLTPGRKLIGPDWALMYIRGSAQILVCIQSVILSTDMENS